MQLMTSRNFDIPFWRLFLLFVLSTAVGLIIYTTMMVITSKRLSKAIRDADVIENVLASDPRQIQGVPGEDPPKAVVQFETSLLTPAKKAERRNRLIDLLTLLKVINSDAATRLRAEASLENTDVRLIAALFDATSGDFAKLAFDPRSRTTTSLIVAAMSVGANSCGDQSDAFKTSLEHSLIDAVAQAPGPGIGFLSAGLGKNFISLAAKAVDLDSSSVKTLDCSEYFNVTWWQRAPSFLTFSTSQSVSDAQILEALYTAFRLNAASGFQWPISEKVSGDNPRLAEDLLEKFLLSLISEIRADPNVRREQLWVTVVRGWEQAGMLVLACFVAQLLWARRSLTLREIEKLEGILPGISRRRVKETDVEARRKSAAEEVRKILKKAKDPSKSVVLYLASMARNYASRSDYDDRRADEFRAVCDLESRSMFSSAWPIRTGLALIPALGFLGTVRGILIALADIDEIVRAGSTFEQASAVSQIGTSLGLAFATTAVALVLGVALRVASDVQTAHEETLVLDCEAELTRLVDPTLWEEAA